MKKSLAVILIFLLVLNIGLVLAQDAGDTDADPDADNDPNIPDDIEDGVDDVGDSVGDLSGVGDSVGAGADKVSSKTNEALEKEIKIPENLQIFSRYVFGVKGEIDIQKFVILICVWAVLFLIVQSIIKLIPMFRGWKSWLLAAIVTILFAASGAVNSVTVMALNFGNAFGFMERWSVLRIVVTIILLGILFYGAHILIRIIDKKLMLEEASDAGTKAGAGVKMMGDAVDVATEE